MVGLNCLFETEDAMRTCPSLPLLFTVRCCGGVDALLSGCQLLSYTVRGMSGRCSCSHERSIFGSLWVRNHEHAIRWRALL